jgi:signal transduction histidine kinase
VIHKGNPRAKGANPDFKRNAGKRTDPDGLHKVAFINRIGSFPPLSSIVRAGDRDSMSWLMRFPRTTIGIVGAILILAGGTTVGFLNLRNLQRIDAVHTRIADLERLRELRGRMEISLLDEIRGGVPTGSFLAEDVRLQVESVLALEHRLNPETAGGLRQIESLLSRPGMVNREALINALELAGSIAELEARSQEDLLRQIREDGRRELYAGLAGLLALAALAALAAWLLPKRLLNPLADLRSQFVDLGEGRFQELSLAGVDTDLIPLFENYNGLVKRLARLEEERKARAETLESEVRAGARALLEQHRVLAEAERMAAVGETAAGLAHELRNPLAGILAGLENLSREMEDAAIVRRTELLHQEGERMVRLLNAYLDSSRHAPEPVVMTNLGGLVRELLSLVRYQASPSVELTEAVEEKLECLIPPGRIRQSLLNLVVNSLQALEPSSGSVKVLAGRKDDTLIVEVRDDGPGFPDDLLAVAGQPFRTRRDSGTGLGLATVRRTVVDLGGSMTIKNLEPRGASVVLKLPCQRSVANGEEEPMASA